GRIVFPEVDYQLISEMERIAKTTTSKGVVSYFVVSEYGHQYAKNDHQFSALICFALANAEYLMKPTRSLPKPSALLQKPKL
ncbi:MAG: hypothetical protein N2385_14480, partial [Chloroflexus sp.]|nr:hypothetical protein [Chloroflexus sp.]